MSSLLKRLITGVIYIAVVVAAILFTDWAFALLCTLFGILGLVEFDKLSRSVGSLRGPAMTTDLVFAIMILVSGVAGCPNHMVSMLAIVLLYIIVRLSVQLYLHTAQPIVDVAKSMLSLCWVVLPLASLELIFDFNRMMVLVLFVMIWLNDTGAYCTGSMLGRHKLFESISPKKTWEGWAGGFAFTAIFGWFVPVIPFLGLESLPQWLTMLLGVVVSITATYGDLTESMFKRALHAKDSGHVLPGHGGILDRIDSLLFAAPATLLFLLLAL